MESVFKNKKLHIGGMTCVNCQNKIEKKLRKTAGVKSARVSYSLGTAEVTYDGGRITPAEIANVVQGLGYKVLSGAQPGSPGIRRIAGLLLVIVAGYAVLQQTGVLNLFVPSQLAGANMGYGMLFVIGLLTSVHCVAMCGGINLSQCIPQAAQTEAKAGFFATFRPAFLYNAGRVVSYTAVGFVVGGLGAAITFSNLAQGLLKLAAGVFMVIMGLSMLNIFPWLRRLVPRMPKAIANKIGQKTAAATGPFLVGLLNGLMPCGPLQAMQIYALSTGSPFAGALSMFVFSMGTVPLMLGLGALSSALGKKFTHKAMTVGAVLVVVLGLSMLSQGWSLSGLSLPQPGASSTPAVQAVSAGTGIVTENGVQLVASTLTSGRYPAITVEAGTPVQWTITAPEGSLNGCNNRMFIPAYGIEHQFKTGENVIEFTPQETGTFSYSCWMGMIRSTITVVEPAQAPSA
ncbi:MAG: sulfite exporter TauE/SafE family protein [Oscillospiraceae bacterium]